MIGWISLHRKIQEHELWQDKPFSRGQAWIDILLMVNHQDEKIMFDGNITMVERGSRITSIRKLSNRWGWSNSKVIKFLKLLQDEKMLDYISDKKKTVITVINYDLYQNEDTQKRHRNDTETPLKHTNNNDNNDNNVNKDIPLKKESKIFTKEDKEYLLAEYLSTQISKRLDKPLKEEKDLQRWAADFEKMVRLDKHDINEIKEVLMFSQKNDFWQTNILSAGKLRKQYLTLLAQMKRDKGKATKETKPNKFHNFIKSDDISGDDLERIANERWEKKIKEMNIKNEGESKH